MLIFKIVPMSEMGLVLAPFVVAITKVADPESGVAAKLAAQADKNYTIYPVGLYNTDTGQYLDMLDLHRCLNNELELPVGNLDNMFSDLDMLGTYSVELRMVGTSLLPSSEVKYFLTLGDVFIVNVLKVDGVVTGELLSSRSVVNSVAFVSINTDEHNVTTLNLDLAQTTPDVDLVGGSTEYKTWILSLQYLATARHRDNEYAIRSGLGQLPKHINVVGIEIQPYPPLSNYISDKYFGGRTVYVRHDAHKELHPDTIKYLGKTRIVAEIMDESEIVAHTIEVNRIGVVVEPLDFGATEERKKGVSGFIVEFSEDIPYKDSTTPYYFTADEIGDGDTRRLAITGHQYIPHPNT